MFTGLVEEIGTISSLLHLDSTSTGGQGTSLTINSCPLILSDARLGDSIACNGTCLTITELLHGSDQDTSTPQSTNGSPSSSSATNGASTENGKPAPTAFKVTIAPETLRRTNLGSLKEGMKLNLERAARADTRMGGHYVQGHVDSVAVISEVREDGNAVVYRFSLRKDEGNDATGHSLLKYIVEKGYVSIDGASLTVTQEGPDWWEVMLIPYTRERIVMGSKGKGDLVNVEVDMVGKYVEKSVRAYFEQGGQGLPGLEAAIRRIVGK